MYVLVLFTDGISYICKPSHISASRTKCPSVKYKDRKKYAARILALHANYAVLLKIKENLNNEVNSVRIVNLQYTKEELLYHQVLQQSEDPGDGDYLYLDTSILPCRVNDSENYVFSQRAVEKSSNYFDVQSLFIKVESAVFEDCDGENNDVEIDVSAYQNESHGSTSTQETEQAKNEIDFSKNEIHEKKKMCVEKVVRVVVTPCDSFEKSVKSSDTVNNQLVDFPANDSSEDLKKSINENCGDEKITTADHSINTSCMDTRASANNSISSGTYIEPSTMVINKYADFPTCDLPKDPKKSINDENHCDEKMTTADHSINTSCMDTRASANNSISSGTYLEPSTMVINKYADFPTCDSSKDPKKSINDENHCDEKMTTADHSINTSCMDTRASANNSISSGTSLETPTVVINRYADFPTCDSSKDPKKSINDENDGDKKMLNRVLTINATCIDITASSSPRISLGTSLQSPDMVNDECIDFPPNEKFEIANTTYTVDLPILELPAKETDPLEIWNQEGDTRWTTLNVLDNTAIRSILSCGASSDDNSLLLNESMTLPAVNLITPEYPQRSPDAVDDPNERDGTIQTHWQRCPAKSLGKPRITSDKIFTLPIIHAIKHPDTTGPSGHSIVDVSSAHCTDSSGMPRNEDIAESTAISILDNMVAGNIFTRNIDISDSPLLANASLTPPAVSSTMLEGTTSTINAVDAGYTEEHEDSEDENDSEDNYIPSEEEQSDNSEEVVKEVSHTVSKNNPVIDITLGLNKPGMSAPDDSELTISTSETPSHTKKHFCLYCKKFQTKLARHLESAHADEEDVKKFSKLPPKNGERREIIAAIRKNGDHLYNTDKRFNTGKLLVCRRPNIRLNKTAGDFLACGKCKGQYARSDLRHHWKTCAKLSGKEQRIVMVKGRKVSARIHEKANAAVRTHVFPYLREDIIVRGVRYDELIVIYANKQCDKYGTHQHHYPMIRSRIRLLGRFLHNIRQINHSIKNLTGVFQPRNYDDAIAAIKIVAGFDEKTRMFAHPATASNLGTLLKHVGDILRSEFIKREEEHNQKRVEDFLKLQSEDYGTSVNRAVAETQMQNRRRKNVVLPSEADIQKLHEFLKVERDTHFKNLRDEFSMYSWRKLAEASLTSLQLFNRRRPGETERLYLNDFNGYKGIDKVANKDTYNSLSKEAKALARKYVRFEIRGKLGRGVAVLLDSNLLDCLLLIIEHRVDAQVPENNPYLFGLSSNDTDRFRHLRACDLIRKYSAQCGATLPSTLRGTELRKHIATRCIHLNLSENQVAELANFMGHDKEIHKKIYRQPVPETDIVKISKLLQIAQGPEESSDDSSEESEDEENNKKENKAKTNSELSTPKNFNARKRQSVSEAEDVSSGNTEEALGPSKRAGTSQCKKKKGNGSKSLKYISMTQGRSTHRRWTDEEVVTVLTAFKEILRKDKMPTGDAMQELIKNNDCLRGRTVPQVRTWLHTQKKKKVEGN